MKELLTTLLSIARQGLDDNDAATALLILEHTLEAALDL
jgi:hypothetical protein